MAEMLAAAPLSVPRLAHLGGSVPINGPTGAAACAGRQGPEGDAVCAASAG